MTFENSTKARTIHFNISVGVNTAKIITYSKQDISKTSRSFRMTENNNEQVIGRITKVYRRKR